MFPSHRRKRDSGADPGGFIRGDPQASEPAVTATDLPRMEPETVQGVTLLAGESPAQDTAATPKSTPAQPAGPNGTTMPNGDPSQPTTNGEDKTPPAPAPSRPPPILCLGMAKTGTASLCAALRHLGLKKVHHGLETSIGKEFRDEWRVLDRAADATFPNLPSYRGTPFSREEWDEVFGKYDAVSDIASFYGPALVKAYPDAKVILVERDIERWLESADALFRPASSDFHQRLVRAVERRTGSTAGHASLKFRMGWTGAKKPSDCLKNMRASYIRHYKEIKELVPKEQLLEYKLSEGWAPLCDFLGREVPDVEFPHVNDKVSYKEYTKKARDAELKKLAKTVLSR